jgi:acetyl-CoA C-acetyltransferase
MGEIAELLADEFQITREEMDRFSTESHQRVAKAQASGALAAQMTPVSLPQRRGEPLVIDRDECVRPETTPETLARLRPAFRKDGRVTAGNSSPMNDGAAACVAMSEAACDSDGTQPAAWLQAATAVGLLPARMGMGPAIAIPRLLAQAGLTQADIDLFEINEAFASQILAVNRELKIPAEKLNVNGGAIAIGHPLGASGLRIVVALIHALRARGLRRGVASLCVGGGQGMAVLIETPEET